MQRSPDTSYTSFRMAILSQDVESVQEHIQANSPIYLDGEIPLLYFAANMLRVRATTPAVREVFLLMVDYEDDINRQVKTEWSPGHELFECRWLYSTIGSLLQKFVDKGGNPLKVDPDPMRYLSKIAESGIGKFFNLLRTGVIPASDIPEVMLTQVNRKTIIEYLINGVRTSELPLFYEQFEEFDFNLLWETPRGKVIDLINARLGNTHVLPPDMLARSSMQRIEDEGFEFTQAKRPSIRM